MPDSRLPHNRSDIHRSIADLTFLLERCHPQVGYNSRAYIHAVCDALVCTYMYAYHHSCKNTYIHIYITYIHTYIHTSYIHYIHSYIHTYTGVAKGSCGSFHL